MFMETLRAESTSGRIHQAAFPAGLTNSAGRGSVGPGSINMALLTEGDPTPHYFYKQGPPDGGRPDTALFQ
jgi:hypothetical protein